MKSMVLDDSTMSNITSASNEAASLSSSSNKNNEVGTTTMYPPPPSHELQIPQSSYASLPINSSDNINQTQTNKKKRNLPGNPDPEAEVIAMSPKTLMATNRFICEICNKGFQRDQNLQLHRRGHNLPWKLKQRSKTEVVKKKVYICPEPSCVHHEASRALGDLTGIKKHFSRKHGEKKWKCDKCSKRYAVQSDWKAHSKICGTREYRCDCGTLFSRRDSFITHRAFCGAIAGENLNARSSSSTLLSPNQLPLHLPISFQLKTEPQHHFLQHPQVLNPNMMTNNALQHQLSPSWFMHHHHQQQNHQAHPNNNDASNNNNLDHDHLCSPNSHMSATALLQKAAQIGVTTSKPALASTNTTTANIVISQQQQQQQHQSILSGTHQLHDHMCAHTSLLTTAHHHHTSGPGNLSSSDHDNNIQQGMLLGLDGAGFPNPHSNSLEAYNGFQEAFFGQATTKGASGGNDELTRDFLGLTGFPPPDQHFLNINALNEHLSTNTSPYNHYQQQSHEQHDPNQLPWNG